MRNLLFISALVVVLLGCSRSDTDYGTRSDTTTSGTTNQYGANTTRRSSDQGGSLSQPTAPQTAQSPAPTAPQPAATVASGEQPVTSPATSDTALGRAVTAGTDAISQRIRKAIMDDQTLATGAKNLEVTMANGTITLRGNVPSEEVKKNIETKAQQVAGVARVDNQLQVKAE